MLRLRDQLFHCRSGGRTIFLDVEADRYFCLSPELDRLFLRFQNAALGSGEQEFAPLVEKAVLVSDSQPALRIESLVPPRPALNAFGAISTGRNLAFTSLAIGHHFLTRYKLRRIPLVGILEGLAARSRAVRVREESVAGHQVARVVTAFDRAGIILGVADKCLVRSISMLTMMHSIGASPYLVFGVRTNPFSAHCWIQDDDIVLNDAPEHARLFEPILAL